MPETKSIVVLGHHITKAEEWIWYDDPDGRYFCEANDHMSSLIELLLSFLPDSKNKIVPYPHESGLQFRYVAQAAGMGRIGRNSFLLHPEWGSWTLLRVFVTSEELDETSGEIIADYCEDCDKCIQVCPADAFKGGFDGLKCRSYRTSRGDYKPIGKERYYKGCKKCAIVCKIGSHPKGRFPRL
ncbi:hypothetical protein ACFL7D_09620 [candidate division KSB1 bacterium]